MAPTRKFGATWWGKAWLESLETSQFAHDGRLGRGRTYARQDRVREVEVAPGLVSSRVWGTSTYATTLAVKTLSDDQWDRLIDLIVSKARYSAELLSGAMPQGLAADAAEAKTPLLPTAGDLTPDCSCPDWGDPCKHAAALCYITGDLIDDDPFVLFFVRGRDRASIVDEVRLRRSVLAGNKPAEPVEVDESIGSVEAFSGTVRSLPNGRPLPSEAGRPNPLRISPPADSGLDNRQLERLAADAAARAMTVLAGEGTTGLGSSVDGDLMRRAAGRRSHGLSLDRFAPLFNGSDAELEAGAIAWERGGEDGVSVATDTWSATAEELAPAKTILGSKARKNGNAMHAGAVQLRLDRELRWWRFESDDHLGWVLSAGPFESVDEALG